MLLARTAGAADSAIVVLGDSLSSGYGLDGAPSEIVADGVTLPMHSSAGDFEAAETGAVVDGPWLKVRTRTDVESLSIR